LQKSIKINVSVKIEKSGALLNTTTSILRAMKRCKKLKPVLEHLYWHITITGCISP